MSRVDGPPANMQKSTIFLVEDVERDSDFSIGTLLECEIDWERRTGIPDPSSRVSALAANTSKFETASWDRKRSVGSIIDIWTRRTAAVGPCGYAWEDQQG